MTALRGKMIEDMRLAGLSERTQTIYVSGIRKLAGFYKRSPDLLSEEEVGGYLSRLIHTDHVAQGTFKTARFAIQFLYRNTLGREWALLKKRSARHARSVYPSPWLRRTSAGSLRRFATPACACAWP